MYDVQFLFHAKTLEKYTTGDCKYFATRLAEEIGGTVVGIGTDAYEGYRDEEGDAYTNPAHYLVQRDDRYVDITGVFHSLKDMLAHYNTFYKLALPDIVDKIDIRLWTEPKQGAGERCDATAREADEVVRTLLSFIDIESLFERSPEYSVKFVTPYNGSNDEFCRAAQIVLDAEVFRDEDEIAFARVGNVCFDSGGIFREGYTLKRCHRVEIHDLSDDVVWSVASIKLEILLGPNAFLDEWYHRPMFPLESIAYLYLPQVILDQAQYPFKGAMLDADFSEEVKDLLREGDLYSIVGEYFDFSSSEDYVYDTRALVALLTELWYNAMSKEPLRTAFLAARVTDSTLQYVQRSIAAFNSLPRLSYERDLSTLIVDPNHHRGGYRQFKREEYTILEVQLTEWSYVTTAIIGARLNTLNISGVARTHVADTGRENIFISPYCIPVDLSGEDMNYLLFALESFIRILRNVNRHSKFFYGYRSGNLGTDGKRFYLFDFTESIYSDGNVEVSQERENDLAKELDKEYGLDIFSFDSEHYIALDTLCFYRASQTDHSDPEVKEYCAREIQRLVTHLTSVLR